MKTKLDQDRLAHFRQELLDKRRQLEAEVGRNTLYGKASEDDAMKDLADQASTAYTREFRVEMGNGDRRLLREVQTAIEKLDAGGFGDCERCGEPIAEKRLLALPFARYCIDCQRRVERKSQTAGG